MEKVQKEKRTIRLYGARSFREVKEKNAVWTLEDEKAKEWNPVQANVISISSFLLSASARSSHFSLNLFFKPLIHTESDWIFRNKGWSENTSEQSHQRRRLYSDDLLHKSVYEQNMKTVHIYQFPVTLKSMSWNTKWLVWLCDREKTTIQCWKMEKGGDSTPASDLPSPILVSEILRSRIVRQFVQEMKSISSFHG